MRLKGFTLIEIIIAVVIIGILVAAASLNYEKVRSKSRDTKRKADMSNIAIAMDSYYSFEKKYPGERNTVYYIDPTTHVWPSVITNALKPHLSSLPVEPGPNFGGNDIANNPCNGQNTRNYNYHTENCAGASPCASELVGGYALIARLELDDDPDVTSRAGCGGVDVRIGNNTTLNLKGHPLFVLTK